MLVGTSLEILPAMSEGGGRKGMGWQGGVDCCTAGLSHWPPRLAEVRRMLFPHEGDELGQPDHCLFIERADAGQQQVESEFLVVAQAVQPGFLHLKPMVRDAASKLDWAPCKCRDITRTCRTDSNLMRCRMRSATAICCGYTTSCFRSSCTFLVPPPPPSAPTTSPGSRIPAS